MSSTRSMARRRRLAVATALAAMVFATGCAARFEPSDQAGAPVVGAPADDGSTLVVDEETGEVVAIPSPGSTVPGAAGPAVPGTTPGTTPGTAPGSTVGPRPGSTTPGRPGATSAPTRPGSTASQRPSTVDPGRKTGVTGSTIKLAYLIPKTGAAPVPPQVEQGIRAYWDFLRTKGGIAGRNVQVSIYDTTSNEQVAREVAQRAIDDGNFAVLALDRLGVSAAIGKFLDDRQVPNLMVQTPVNVPSRQSWTFGLTIDHDEQGTMIAQYFKRGIKQQKVAVVYETDNTLKPGVEAFKTEAKKLGLDVVYETQISGDSNDFSAQASQLRTSGATATWLYMAPIPAAKLASQADAIGYHPIWFANSISWNFNIVFGNGANRALRDARAFSPWPALNDPRTATYKSAYRSLYADPPDDLGIPGWGIGQIVAAALQQVGPDLGQNNFRHAMQNLQLTGTSAVDRSPLLWSPLTFAPGVRTGARQVVTYKEQSMSWVVESDYRSGY